MDGVIAEWESNPPGPDDSDEPDSDSDSSETPEEKPDDEPVGR